MHTPFLNGYCDITDPRSGHIPGSVSLPHPELLDSNTGLLKSLDDIQQSQFKLSFLNCRKKPQQHQSIRGNKC